ncbi:hypothetical protein K1719_031393 [Acacia pycnantha]|nr:hypothetical protein K1719_031393 [Acacia pycnantha]
MTGGREGSGEGMATEMVVVTKTRVAQRLLLGRRMKARGSVLRVLGRLMRTREVAQPVRPIEINSWPLDVGSVPEETEDEGTQIEQRQEGRAGVLTFTADEYATWCLPWMNSLIIKVLGTSFPTYLIRDRINRMWRPKDPLKLIPLSNDYYIVSFSNKEDRDYAFQEGPWMIEDHYLIVQRWRPNFNPWKADLQCRIAAWVRLPEVPFEFYNVESLRIIGNMIGRMIKIDRSTLIYDKGGFARICVELDLQQPLLPSYMVFGEERSIIYKGLHHVCFSCGKYGHKKDKCPTVQKVEEPQVSVAAATGDSDKDTTEKGVDSGSGATIVSGNAITGDSPFSKIQILHREVRGAVSTADMRQVANMAPKKSVDQRKSDDISGSHRVDMKKEIVQGNKANQDEGIKGKGPLKSEWEVHHYFAVHDSHVVSLPGASILTTSSSLDLTVNGAQGQVGTSVTQDNMDQQMSEQDNIEGEMCASDGSSQSQELGVCKYGDLWIVRGIVVAFGVYGMIVS